MVLIYVIDISKTLKKKPGNYSGSYQRKLHEQLNTVNISYYKNHLTLSPNSAFKLGR